MAVQQSLCHFSLRDDIMENDNYNRLSQHVYHRRFSQNKNKKIHRPFFFSWLLLFITCLVEILRQHDFGMILVVEGKQESVIRWAGSGGGWRAMVSTIGFINTFKNSGLLDLEKKQFNITSMSTNSGSTWALTQLAYSQDFFDKAVPSNSSNVYPFIIQLMNSTQTFINDNYSKYNITNNLNSTQFEACKLISPLNINPSLLDWENFCLVFTKTNFSWANLMDQLFVYASQIAFNDSSFADRIMNETNRIPIFQNTDLYAQLAVMPVSKIVVPTGSLVTLLQLFLNLLGSSTTKSRTNLFTYIGPANNITTGFTVPIPCIYSVTSQGSQFRYGVPPSMLPLKAYSGPATNTFRFTDWTDYDLYDNVNRGSIVTELPEGVRNNPVPFQDPFDNGQSTVTQVSAASSASLSGYTGIIPSFLAQYKSVTRYDIQTKPNITLREARKELKRLQFQTNLLYLADFLKDIAVCDRWPQPCRKGNYILVDGVITDGPTIAMNVGEYHRQHPATYRKVTLKVILTNHNSILDQNANILSYFSTYFNQGVPPGGFVWAPGVLVGERSQRNPFQSMQIFSEYFDNHNLSQTLTPVSTKPKPFWNITTATYNCTTVYNPAFGVLPDQNVQLLLIRINSAIPTNAFTNTALNKWTKALASMALDIATDPELISRVRQFALS